LPASGRAWDLPKPPTIIALSRGTRVNSVFGSVTARTSAPARPHRRACPAAAILYTDAWQVTTGAIG
jgi:hypothetical protein